VFDDDCTAFGCFNGQGFSSSFVYLMAEMVRKLFIRMLFDCAMNVLLVFW